MASSNILRVYDNVDGKVCAVRSAFVPLFASMVASLHLDTPAYHEQLEVLATYTLFGTIQSMASARLRNTDRDTLFLSFMDAKLSVVEYDPSNHDLKTVSCLAAVTIRATLQPEGLTPFESRCGRWCVARGAEIVRC